ncbi:hypothetical protein C0580_02530 [Candidatus Parcubacteria bacterium]|nr:MAG: hypothetical protein C0580_02530 [Candidatus Parcubacteria bacterium]
MENFKKLLVKAKKATYASGDKNQKIKEADGSTSLFFEEANFKYHDNYFGGEPYGGREVAFIDNKAVYIMTYYGQVTKNIKDIERVYSFLQKALSLVPEDKPFRGPKQYKEDKLEYTNTYNGEIDEFFGQEFIKENGKKIYSARYMGGLINTRK